MTLLNNLNLDGVEYEFGGYATRFFTYDEDTGYLTFTGANRYTFDSVIYCGGVIWTGGKTSTSDGKAGIAVGANGTLHLQGVDNNPYIGFYGKDQTGYGATISYKVDNDYLYFGNAARYYFYNTLITEGHVITDYGVYTGGKTTTTDGKTGAFLSQNGRLMLQNTTGNPYITFYGPDATDSEDAYISYNITNDYLVFGGATRYTFGQSIIISESADGIFTGGKTKYGEGKAGVHVRNNGRIYMEGDSVTPGLYFYHGGQTSNGTNIVYDSTDDYLKFNGATHYVFDNNVYGAGGLWVTGGVGSGGKTQSGDGKAGVMLLSTGSVHIQNLTGNPYVGFYGNGQTGYGTYISYNVDTDYLHFGGATRYIFSADIDTSGVFRLTSGGTTATGVNVNWADSSSHYIVYKGADGLTAYFGWAGSSTYASVSVLRGRTVKYSDSSGTTTLSDERLKKDFTTLDEWDTFFDAIEPCAFRMKGGSSGRFHMGFKAQQVEQALINCGKSTKDFAGFIRMPYRPDSDDPEGNELYEAVGIKPGDDEFGLVYTEFTALNTDQIQKLKARVKHLEELVEKLQV